MLPLMVSKAWLSNLLESHSFGNGQVLISVFSGLEESVSGNNFWDLVSEIESDVLIDSLPDGSMPPTIVEVLDDSSVWPASVAVFVNNVHVTLPAMDVTTFQSELNALLETISELTFDSSATPEQITSETWDLLRPHLQRGTGWVSGLTSTVAPGDQFEWWGDGMDVLDDDKWEGRFVVLTSANAEALHSTCIWRRWWHPIEREDEMLTRVQWESPCVELLEVDNEFAVFDILDGEGSITFRIRAETFPQFNDAAQRMGFTYRDSRSSEQQSIEAGQNPMGSPGAAPLPQPTVQPAGAPHHNGIVQGNVNVTGLAVLAGIVQGDVNVPVGSDVDITGIVQGTVRVDGGIARIHGTAAAAVITSGKIEIYGILQSPLTFLGGEVYRHPSSIVAQ